MTEQSLNPNKVGIDVVCTVCGNTKAPVGRSTPMSLHYCHRDTCDGYDMEPKPGWLFRGETEEDFGYPCPDAGTRLKT